LSLAPDDNDDHRCKWRDEAEQLRAEMEELRQKFASLERRVLGPKSEKMPSIHDEVRRQRPASAEDAYYAEGDHQDRAIMIAPIARS